MQSKHNDQMDKSPGKGPFQFGVQTGQNVPVIDDKEHIPNTRNTKTATKKINEEYCHYDCKEIRRLKEENRILSRVIKNIFHYKKIERTEEQLGTLSPVMKSPKQ